MAFCCQYLHAFFRLTFQSSHGECRAARLPGSWAKWEHVMFVSLLNFFNWATKPSNLILHANLASSCKYFLVNLFLYSGSMSILRVAPKVLWPKYPEQMEFEGPASTKRILCRVGSDGWRLDPSRRRGVLGFRKTDVPDCRWCNKKSRR